MRATTDTVCRWCGCLIGDTTDADRELCSECASLPMTPSARGHLGSPDEVAIDAAAEVRARLRALQHTVETHSGKPAARRRRDRRR